MRIYALKLASYQHAQVVITIFCRNNNNKR